MLILSFGCLRFLRESCLLYAFLLGYLPSIFFGLFLQNLLTFICRTAYVLLAVKRKRQSYIKKKQRDNEKENRTKKEAEQSEFRTAGYDMWCRMEPRIEKLMAAMQQLSLKERFVVTEYVLKGKPFKESAQETGLKEKGVASAYYRSIKKLRAEMGDVK